MRSFWSRTLSNQLPPSAQFLGFEFINTVVASACPAGGLHRALPSHNRPALTFRRAVAIRHLGLF